MQDYEERLEVANQANEDLRAEVKTLQEKNERLQAKNDELTQKIKALEAELRTKIRIVPNR